MKRIRLHDILIHIYMIASVLAVVLIIPARDTSNILFALGAKSWFTCLVLGGAGAFNQYIGVLAFLWVVAFPFLFLIFYIMACKKIYNPFCIITTMDTIIALLWFVRCLTIGDAYALEAATLDAVVSFLYCAVLIICLSIRGTGDGFA